MDQTTAFSPHLHVRLLDGRTVKFARSTIDHWIELCERYKASVVDAKLQEIADIPSGEVTPIDRANARAEVRELEVPIGGMVWRCQNVPAWIKAHLAASLTEAGFDAADVLPLIPWQQQQELALHIAALPVVKGDPTGTEANPIVAGVEIKRPNASTGDSKSPTSDGTAPASTSAA